MSTTKKVDVEAKIYLLLGLWLFFQTWGTQRCFLYPKNGDFNFCEGNTLMTQLVTPLTSQSVGCSLMTHFSHILVPAWIAWNPCRTGTWYDVL